MQRETIKLKLKVMLLNRDYKMIGDIHVNVYDNTYALPRDIVASTNSKRKLCEIVEVFTVNELLTDEEATLYAMKGHKVNLTVVAYKYHSWNGPGVRSS